MRESAVLLSTAEPKMYEKNIFRISGASVYTDTKEVKRRLNRLEKSLKFGAIPSSEGSMLPLASLPDLGLVREALQKINDPEQRLVHEFFWFWPLNRSKTEQDEALQALKNKETKTAQKIWTNLLKDNRQKVVALHNLAIIHHLFALELESSVESSSNGVLKQRADHWANTYKYWRELTFQGAFWNKIKDRIIELDDPRLGPANYRTIENSIPLALLSINVKLALSAIEKSRQEDTNRHKNLIYVSGFPDDTVRESLRRGLEPIRNRIKTLCKAAEEKGEKEPDNVPEIVEKLLEATVGLLNIMDEVLPENHSARIGARDEVAKTSFQLTIPYINEKEDWATAERLFIRAKEIALSESLLGRIQQNIHTVQTNLEMNKCHFCKENQKTDSASISVAMYGDVSHNYYQGTINWKHIKIKVPRCQRCKQYHEFTGDDSLLYSIGCGVSIVGILLTLGIFSAFEISTTFNWIGYVFALIATVVGFWFGAKQKKESFRIRFGVYQQELEKKIKPVSDQFEYSEIKEMRKEGWKYGDSPPEAQ